MSNLKANRSFIGLLMVLMMVGSFSFVNPADLDAAPRSQVQADTQILVNVNQAGLEELQSVRGIGPLLAERIIAYRDEKGPFEQPEDLSRVRGIGGAKLQKIKHQISV